MWEWLKLLYNQIIAEFKIKEITVYSAKSEQFDYKSCTLLCLPQNLQYEKCTERIFFCHLTSVSSNAACHCTLTFMQGVLAAWLCKRHITDIIMLIYDGQYFYFDLTAIWLSHYSFSRKGSHTRKALSVLLTKTSHKVVKNNPIFAQYVNLIDLYYVPQSTVWCCTVGQKLPSFLCGHHTHPLQCGLFLCH